MTTAQTTERIAGELKQGMADAQDVLNASAGQAGEALDQMRRRLMDALEAARAACGTAEVAVRDTAASSDRTIRANPYGAIGIAFAVGILIGVFVNRK